MQNATQDIAETIIQTTDADRFERARQQIADGQLRVTDLHITDQSIAATVETKVVKTYKRKPSQITRSVYQVRLNSYEHSCSCPDWEYRGAGQTHKTSGQIKACKHQLAAALWAYAQAKQENAA